VKTTRKI